MRGDHIDAVQEAVDYIQEHLYDGIDLEAVADHACFSRHYFNRLFSAVMGESIHEFARRLRLEQAAFRLLKRPDMSVTSIAAEAGYSPSNFASAFKSNFGMSASAYRSGVSGPREPAYAAALERISRLRNGGPEAEAVLAGIRDRIEVVELPALRLYRRSYRGPYLGLAAAWESFCGHVEKTFPGLEDPRYVGISYDDPLITEGSLLRYSLCVDLPPGICAPRLLRIPEKRYARYRFFAPLSELVHVFYDLVALWMPRQGLSLEEAPCLEIYDGGVDSEGRIAVDVCAPIDDGLRAAAKGPGHGPVPRPAI